MEPKGKNIEVEKGPRGMEVEQKQTVEPKTKAASTAAGSGSASSQYGGGGGSSQYGGGQLDAAWLIYGIIFVVLLPKEFRAKNCLYVILNYELQFGVLFWMFTYSCGCDLRDTSITGPCLDRHKQ